MKKLFLRPLTIATATLWLATNFALAMPKDLVQAGTEIGCEPVADFFKRDGQIEPDYLNSQDGRPNLDGTWRASFWCRPKTKKNVYWLVFVSNGMPYQRDGCNPIVEWFEKPKGLSIHSQNLELNSMYELEKKRTLTSKELTLYKPIIDIYDGSGYAFYCHEKKWYVAPLD